MLYIKFWYNCYKKFNEKNYIIHFTNYNYKKKVRLVIFLSLENIISFRHVKNFQNLDLKNLAFNTKKVHHPYYSTIKY